MRGRRAVRCGRRFSLVFGVLGDRSVENGAAFDLLQNRLHHLHSGRSLYPYDQALGLITREAVAARLARSVPTLGERDQRPGLAIIVIGGARQRLANGQWLGHEILLEIRCDRRLHGIQQ